MTGFYKKIRTLKFFYKIGLIFLFFFLSLSGYLLWIFLNLPPLFNVSDYKPPLLTQVYDKNGSKVGEFYRQRRLLAKYEDMPDFLIQAFISAEDGAFFSHSGINLKAIVRAFIANLKAGKKIQGGSTITQQLARTLLLSSKKTYTRKIKEAVLALRMEGFMTKQDILYIYLNQIYLGHGAYGVEMAARTYFRKSIKEISLPEAALLAGLPKAPSRFSPTVNPDRAKSRQIYVLNRMRQEGYISEKEMETHLKTDIKIFIRKDFSSESPYYMESVRLSALNYIEEKDLLEGALKIHTAMDRQKQKQAQKSLKKGLEDWDKRKGFRPLKKNIEEPEKQKALLEAVEKKLRSQIRTDFILPGFVLSLENQEDEIPAEFFIEFKEKFKEMEEKNKTKEFWLDRHKQLEGKIFHSLVDKVEEDRIQVLTPWGSEVLNLKDFNWAVPFEKKEQQPILESAKEIFKKNDKIFVRVKEIEEEKQASSQIPLELYQEPLAESALISFDLENSEIIALVGGYSYSRSKYNRAYQARRQSGSVFKPFIYGAALEKGFKPNSLISDSPLVFTPKEAEEKTEESPPLSQIDMWRPSNISNRFLGDLLFRKALIRSLNVPTVKIIKKIGLDWVKFYTQRLGIFSPLNEDYTMALGSSSLTLYETLKAFSVIAKQGKRIQPILIHKVEDSKGQVLISDISLDDFFKEEIQKTESLLQQEREKWFPLDIEEEKQSPFQKRWMPLLEENSQQLIPPSNSYVLMNLLSAVIRDPEGTARRANVLNFPVGGKTGTTDGYYDTWFVGSSAMISTAVWLGFDDNKSLGRGETGSRTALPIWLSYMKDSHKDLAPVEFPVPDDVVFVNIDAETGQWVSSKTQEVIHQAFIEGSEPSGISDKDSEENKEGIDEAQFIREDLSY